MDKCNKIQCLNQHQAQWICAEAECDQPAADCGESGCSCRLNHSQCLYFVEVQKLLKKFKDKTKPFEFVIDKAIQAYEKIMKTIRILIEQSLAMKQNLSQKLQGKAQQLYTLLLEGRSDEIKSSFVNETLKEQLTERENIKKENDRIVLEIESMFDDIESQLANIKKLTETNQMIEEQYLFLEQLAHPNYKVSKEGKRIEVVSQQQYRFAFISPSLETDENSVRKVTLKIIDDKRNLWVGMGALNNIKSSNWTTDSRLPRHGSYIVRCDSGFTYNSWDEKQNNQKSHFKFESGDIITMEYNQEDRKLRLKNVTQDISHELMFQKLTSGEFHFCIWAQALGTSVEILHS